jgi:putative transcriptional regulator
MIRTKLDELRIKKARDLNVRKITLQQIADDTGISPATLTRLGAGNTGAVQFATLSTLCTYFNCEVGDLLQFVPDPEVPA